MNPIVPVSMLPPKSGGIALVVGAVLILAMIYAKRQRSPQQTSRGGYEPQR